MAPFPVDYRGDFTANLRCILVFGWDMNDLCYDNVNYTGWHSGYPDAKVHLDLATYRIVPWDKDVPFFLGEFVDGEDRPLTICPRQLLLLRHQPGYYTDTK